LFKLTCSKGNGDDRVVRLTLPQEMALGIDCTQTGSHVIGISQQLAPLDHCDANLLNCADLSTLPFGCGYTVPDLQPGTYNVIVEAFQAGDEGTVMLTVTGIKEIVRDMCTNGVADCADRQCVTSPECQQFSCMPDKDLGLIPLDGTVHSATVDTATSTDAMVNVACATTPGGDDAVVDFQLPESTDLTLGWAQVGDHVFDLFSDEGMFFACTAGNSVSCTPSLAAATGTKTIMAVPAGSYHLVIDADRPGAEGGVVVSISGKASM
jgi:hypothetical protein